MKQGEIENPSTRKKYFGETDFFIGGGGENRTRVRKPLRQSIYMFRRILI